MSLEAAAADSFVRCAVAPSYPCQTVFISRVSRASSHKCSQPWLGRWRKMFSNTCDQQIDGGNDLATMPLDDGHDRTEFSRTDTCQLGHEHNELLLLNFDDRGELLDRFPARHAHLRQGNHYTRTKTVQKIGLNIDQIRVRSF